MDPPLNRRELARVKFSAPAWNQCHTQYLSRPPGRPIHSASHLTAQQDLSKTLSSPWVVQGRATGDVEPLEPGKSQKNALKRLVADHTGQGELFQLHGILDHSVGFLEGRSDVLKSFQ